MDPINPWIDPGETRRMAERLMLPSREPVSAPEYTGFDDSFVGFSDADPETEMQSGAGDTPSFDAGVEASKDMPAEQPVDLAEEKPRHEEEAPGNTDPALGKPHAMLREKYSAVASFMITSKGEVAFDEGGFHGFHFILKDLVKSAAEPVHMRIKLGARMFLEIIPIEDGDGCNWLGVVVPSRFGKDESVFLHSDWHEAS